VVSRRLVLGLGNDLLGDDGVGPWLIEELRGRPSLAGFDFETADGSGLGLIDVLDGYDRAYVVDCIAAGNGGAGVVERLSADELAARSVNLSSHYAGLPHVLALGRSLGLAMPDVRVLAVGVEDPYRIGTDFSPGMRRKLPAITAEIEHALLEEDDDA
jgi:hydrogenase maturation protease